MKKRYRIKKVREIDEVFSKRKSEGDQYFVIYQQQNNAEHFRFAISIGRKYGSSVERNLCKRRIRMIVRQFKDNIKTNVEFVVVVKPKASTLNFQEIHQKITYLLTKSKIIESKEDK